MSENLSKNIASGIIWNAIRIIIQVITGVVSSFLTARILMNPENYGNYSYINTISSIFCIVAMLGYNVPILQSLGEETNIVLLNSKSIYFLKRCFRNLILVFPLFMIILFILSKISIIPKSITSHLGVISILCLASWLVYFFNTLFMGLKKFKNSNTIVIFCSLIFSFSEIVIYLFKIKIGFAQLALIYSGISLIAVLANISIIKKMFVEADYSLKFSFKPYKSKARSIFLIQLNDLVVWDKSEMFFLGKYGYIFDIGIYSFAYQITTSVSNIVQGMYSNLCIPAFAEITKNDIEKSKKVYFITMNLITGVTTVGYMIVLLLMEFVVKRWLNNYTASLSIFYILFLGKILSSTGAVGSAVIHVNNKTNYSLYTSFITSIINIIMDVWLIKRYGAIGAAIGNTVAQCFGIFFGIFIITKIIKYEFPFKQFVVYTIAFIIFMVLHFSDKFNIQIIIILMIIPITIFLNKATLLNLLNEFKTKRTIRIT